MERNSQIQRAVRQTLVMSAVAAAATLPAHAQDADEVDTIVVTGSRIRSANLEGTTPVTQVTSADIATQGVTRVEDLINQLPQAFGQLQGSTVSNGADGTAQVSLRGLGSSRTLVLIDGRRMPYGGVNSSAADLNQIPTAMVERVEVLTGGSSAVYGSDAVAGVVNFIMKKDFEGVELEAQYGTYQHKNSFDGPGVVKLRDVIAGRAATNPSQFALPDDNVTDGEGVEFSITMGASTDDGRGNITAYASVRDNEEVLQRDRDYSACALAVTDRTQGGVKTGVPDPSFGCGGSATSYPGYFGDFGANFTPDPGLDGKVGTADDPEDANGDPIDINPLPEYAFTVDQATGNTFRNFASATDQYNFGPLNYYQRPDTRYTLGAMGHYELAEYADVYAQLMFSDYESTAQIAPGGAFGETGDINCDNPFLSAQQADAIGCNLATDPNAVTPGNQALVPMYILRRNVEGGGRQDSFSSDSFRGVLGVRGAISENWNYDAFAQFSKVKVDNYTLNRFVLPRWNNALHARTNAAGEIVCADGDPACTPYNPFTIGGISEDALEYLQTPSLEVGRIEQEVYGASVTGDLGGIGLASPLANDSIKMVLGVETRTDRLNTVPDGNLQAGLLMGQGGATTALNGRVKVDEIFTEIRVPLLSDLPGAQQLALDGAYRYSDYDNLSTDTYKVGLEWAPIDDVRFRGSFQRAVRAANVVELFSAQSFNLFDIAADPCGPSRTAPESLCSQTGVPVYGSAALNSPAGQYQLLQGGNPDLEPEESDTTTIGVILQPRFAPKLALSIDYFDIDIQDTISTFGPSNTLSACYVNADPDACSRIRRNPGTGQLWLGDGHVVDTNINIGSLQTSGYDMNLTYAGLEIGRFGELNFNVTATYIDELITEPGPGLEPYDCVGLFADDCLGPTPELRTHSRIGWESPWNVDVALTWRYVDSVEEFRGDSGDLDFELDSENYFDLSANWQVTEKASVLLGINNILDEDPSLNSNVGTTGNGNTYPQAYDALGRFIFLRGKIGF
jgi:outer membrane receptor protein involved in Fe transport